MNTQAIIYINPFGLSFPSLPTTAGGPCSWEQPNAQSSSAFCSGQLLKKHLMFWNGNSNDNLKIDILRTFEANRITIFPVMSTKVLKIENLTKAWWIILNAHLLQLSFPSFFACKWKLVGKQRSAWFRMPIIIYYYMRKVIDFCISGNIYPASWFQGRQTQWICSKVKPVICVAWTIILYYCTNYLNNDISKTLISLLMSRLLELLSCEWQQCKFIENPILYSGFPEFCGFLM